jgi:excinuclease ABC subunit C
LEEFFKENAIHLEIPSQGKKRELVEFAMNQLREYAYKQEMQLLEHTTLTGRHMENVLQVLGYKRLHKEGITFECYDISHTHGYFTYASRVVLYNGKPNTSLYKRYKIQSLKEGDIDDYASHREVMYRRYLEGYKQKNLPDLIIIDGGKGQLSSAMSGIERARFEIVHEYGI